jgi:glycosyltransferase involved in cell wall biosynthesis
MGVPLVVEYNGDHLMDLEAKGQAPAGLQRRLSVALMGGAVRRAAHVVATGEGWREHFIRQWRYDPARVSVIENGTTLVRRLERQDLRAFQPAEAAGSPIQLVYLGAFYAWHGVPVLLRALARARRQDPRLRLCLIGSGNGLAQARQQAAEAGLEAVVEFTGQLEPKAFASRLAQADIGLSPYCGWKEYSGLKLFDYKAAGLAVIASGENDQPVTLRHGQTAWIVPPCDEDALTEAILHLAADPDLRRRLGRQARLEAEAVHGWDHTASQLERVLEQVRRDR